MSCECQWVKAEAPALPTVASRCGGHLDSEDSSAGDADTTFNGDAGRMTAVTAREFRWQCRDHPRWQCCPPGIREGGGQPASSPPEQDIGGNWRPCSDCQRFENVFLVELKFLPAELALDLPPTASSVSTGGAHLAL